MEVSVAQTLNGLRQTLVSTSKISLAVGVTFFLIAAILSFMLARSAVNPLARLTMSISKRGPKDLRPVATSVPAEMVPLVFSLNSLMSRLEKSLARSEDFITEAAHRVRTPLTVVRAKAEIFLGLQSGGTAVINADDRFAAYWAARTRSFQTITFGLDSKARVTGSASTVNGQQVVEVDLPDESFEVLNNYTRDCDNDLFFAMSHGVHRGQLKKGKIDDREIFIKKLVKLNKKITFDIYGMLNSQPIWAGDFINKVSNSSMGLNLSRGKPIKYYSSDRIAQLMGNGLLTFVDKETCLSDYFTKEEIVTYSDIDDLSYKLNKYKRDKRQCKRIAKNGKKKYLKYFNSTLVAEYIINQTLDIKSQKKFLWLK